MSKPSKSSSIFPGFQLSDIAVFSPERVQDHLHYEFPIAKFPLVNVKLALPDTAAARQLVRERSDLAKVQAEEFNDARARAKRIQAAELRRKEEEEAAALTAQSSAAAKSSSSTENLKPRTLAGKTTFDVSAERTRLMSEYEDAGRLMQPGGADRVQIMGWDEPLKLIDEMGSRTPDKDLHERDRELYRQLCERGAYRDIAPPIELERTLTALAHLRREQPHFGEVIRFIESQLRLALELKKPAHIPPILLGGPPGVGKTHFTLALAKLMDRPIHRHNFDASYTGSALMGSDRNWANTRVGLVFKAVCLGERADAIILLDELDKADTYRGAHAAASLLSLLEPVTAREVTDISAGITFNASHLCWIATANELWRVPDPILSRFMVFHIQPPSAREALDLADAVAASVHARFSSLQPPGRRIVALMAHLTPREQIQALDQAYASALVNGRQQILVQDLPADLREAGQDEGPVQMLH